MDGQTGKGIKIGLRCHFLQQNNIFFNQTVRTVGRRNRPSKDTEGKAYRQTDTEY